jgi:hypothetical protein
MPVTFSFVHNTRTE